MQGCTQGVGSMCGGHKYGVRMKHHSTIYTWSGAGRRQWCRVHIKPLVDNVVKGSMPYLILAH